MPTYAARLKRARELAKLTQIDLAAALGVKPQAIQYLENAKKRARGSKYTAGIARATGTDAHWLATGEGQMLPAHPARQESPRYIAHSPDALQVAAAWSRLSPEHQAWARELIYILSTVDSRFPWLRRGRPKGETYEQYERNMEQNYHATVVKAAERLNRG